MIKTLSLLLALTAALPAAADTLLLECEALIDVASGKRLRDAAVLVEGNRIRAVGERRDIERQLGDSEPAARHRLGTCLPGLMDMHVHLDGQSARNSYLRRFIQNEADYALLAAHYAEKTLLAGFTTVRNVGDAFNVTVALRKAIKQGVARGPRIHTAAKSLATTGGHADPTNSYRKTLMGEPGPVQGVINGPWEASEAVRQRYKDGADLIKITATGGVLSLARSGENPQFADEELAAVVAAARDYGMHVAAHAHGAEGMRRAVLAGVRSIEHGTYMTPEVMELMNQRGTFWVPTIVAGEFVAEKAAEDGYYPEVVRGKAATIGPVIFETFKKAYRAGVRIAFGTDSGVSPHGENAREFELMVEGGMPPLEAIQSATLVAAELLERSDELGQLAAGMYADIVAVDGDPLQDISLLRNLSFVMKDGVVYRDD
ncbi:MAG: amidohydrolase family protein [Xanthomonadales bacterium]|nr:amidohydrolase family protein [Xanthomonadales bacterium]NIN60339.1 amidohydrolase family protein [Xanthomonadales bacterium]NIN75691.1 amidohydrolase family protein [Xanthomonadales bacterium]NIO14764.1 amidohydrolase family protein [Xanthomonadales bacterium]NIP12732.1 amidohydrolase family protein [Xanthomonadales bacterium]